MMVDSQEASALSYNRSAIDIYSSSWGPPDTGYTVLGPGPILYSAFQEGSIKVLIAILLYCIKLLCRVVMV